GGMILLHNENATPEMDVFAEQLAKQAYPEFPLVDLPPDHLLYSVVYPMKKKTPLKGVSNGHRLLMVYSPTDITKGWLIRQGRGTNEQAQLGLNLFVYAAGKTNFHGRLITPYIPPPLFAALGSIPIARIKYTGGNWDPEPFAWQRFPRWFQEQTSIALSVTPQAIEELNFPAVPVAVLTGDSAVDFDKMNLQPLHDYVAAGGLVVIDSVAGNQPFIQSVRDKLLPKAFADGQIQQLDTSHPLLAGTGDGMDPLPKAQLRQFAIEQLGHNLPALDIVTLGKGAVIISDIDLTCGLLDTSTWGITGYEPNYCNSLVKNVILWASERYHL
ncbi:MAG TPA: DUF4159 domain-containing protein, partial [Tepidisphaeraceae bacterium]|nr:DUF4159 domain-containing protein [Tepidisphaeraceae bacterium]